MAARNHGLYLRSKSYHGRRLLPMQFQITWHSHHRQSNWSNKNALEAATAAALHVTLNESLELLIALKIPNEISEKRGKMIIAYSKLLYFSYPFIGLVCTGLLSTHSGSYVFLLIFYCKLLIFIRAGSVQLKRSCRRRHSQRIILVIAIFCVRLIRFAVCLRDNVLGTTQECLASVLCVCVAFAAVTPNIN